MGTTTAIEMSPVDWDEMFEYPTGATVELRSHPGVIDVIDYYDPLMVPPIWLVNDPRPRYPHELRVLSIKTAKACQVAGAAMAAQKLASPV